MRTSLALLLIAVAAPAFAQTTIKVAPGESVLVMGVEAAPPPPTCTTPRPADQSRTQTCPSGTTGSWRQTTTSSAAPYPTCWTVSDWSPSSAPAGACTPIVQPPPPPATGAVLDDFESTLRTLDGHPLWDNYGGEGAKASVSLSPSAARVGGKGLLYRMTAGTPYLHLYSNDGSQWRFAKELLTSGTFDAKFNRLGFWVFHPANYKPVTGNRHLIELGTYTRSPTGDRATQNAGGNHFYHYVNPAAGVWTYVVLDTHPQHSVGGPTYDPGIITANGGYMGSLTRIYYNGPYNGCSAFPCDLYFDDFRFFSEEAGDEANIATIEASYDASKKRLHVGFVRNARSDPSFVARYSISPITSSNPGAQFGTVGADGQGDYVNKAIEGTVDLTGASTVYISVARSGQSSDRKIALPLLK